MKQKRARILSDEVIAGREWCRLEARQDFVASLEVPLGKRSLEQASVTLGEKRPLALDPDPNLAMVNTGLPSMIDEDEDEDEDEVEDKRSLRPELVRKERM